ncbi:MAG: DUF1553 domain-containing protein [Planctomycetes bacterium]|nr:DUF1553 domain-containing protein [Planctomycetota bacterium]
MRVAVQLVVGVGLSLLALASFGASQERTVAERSEFFTKKIAPILKKHCLECHNPRTARSGLNLSTRAGLLEGGGKGPAIVPGDAKKSLLAHMIQGPDAKMPRKRPPLADAQIADILLWITDGSYWPEKLPLADKDDAGNDATWWSLAALKRPSLPDVNDKTWSDNPIDLFVLSMLESKGMKPSPLADRRTFIRRVTYDLHGLPPTPEEIEAFVNDESSDAFERLVDRLLASPRYGERWGRHWLDIIHYADTHGYDKDKRRLWAWLFRDWIIRALNNDMPYRRFVRYQVAGDVLFPDDTDGILATGFVAAGPWDFVGHVELREGTVEKEKTRLLDRDDMVANTMSTFNSLTVHCARCHDHKFDPIPQKDYYQLQAVFAGVERGDRPVMLKDLADQKKRLEERHKTLAAHRSEIRQAIEKRVAPKTVKLDEGLKEWRQLMSALPKPMKPAPSRTNGYHSLIEQKPEVTKWVQVDLGDAVPLELVRLFPARPTDFPDTPGFGFPARFQVAVSDEPSFAKSHILLDQSRADFANPGDIPLTIPVKEIKARFVRVTATKLWKRTGDYVFALGELQAISGGKNVALAKGVTALDSIEFGLWSKRYLVDNFDSRKKLADLDDPAEQKRLMLEMRIQEADEARAMIVESVIGDEVREQMKGIDAELASLAQQIDKLKSSAQVYSVLPIPPRPIHVLTRGDVERKGPVANPGSLSLLPGLEHHFKAPGSPVASSPRAALADWLTDDANVLTWRSIVNRVWQYHFGKGLVDTPNDFGKNGSRPTHPELLDWLAAEFRESDSLKKLHRRIVLSKTYRQESTHHAAFAKLDADNRYLWRMHRQRLDAESIRDSVLAVSGKLDRKMYGPGFELFRFKDDHSPVYDHLDAARISDPETWRRTVYRFVVRSVPNPFLESLDCADPNINVPVRNTTLTALQALALLNNPFMVQQADFFAQRLKKASDDPALQVELAYRLAFGRTPTQDERDAQVAYVRRHGLANACRLLLNANEFVFVD